MSRKNKFFSIGEIAKATRASIKSLRYYEEIGLLKPAFTDPHSGYRYFSFDQIFIIDIIQLCIELDIPLKDLTRYIDKDETLDYSDLLSYGKEIAEKKLLRLQKGLRLIENTQQKIALAEKYHQSQQIYTREMPEKLFWVIPYEKPFEEADMFDLLKPFWDMELNEEDYHDFFEYGTIIEFLPEKIKRYIFMELPERIPNVSIKTIPGGKYYCQQFKESEIEHTPNIFKKQLKGKDTFLAIETEVFAAKYKVNKPVNELRVIAV